MNANESNGVLAVMDRTDPLIECAGTFGLSEYQCEQATKKARSELREARAAVAELIAERDRLHALVNNPLTENFLEAVRAEVAHQVERWGAVHDRAKAPADWLWLLGYLAGKALAAHQAGDEHKALHHTISSAAVLANWHAHIRLSGGGTFTPGSSDIQRFLEETFGSAAIARVGGGA